MKKLDGRTKAGRAAKEKALRESMSYWPAGIAKQVAEAQVKENAEIRGSLADILEERESRYGNFADHAGITQRLKQTMYCCPKYSDLQDDQAEALEMIAHKIGRILNGDPNYTDSWVDIAGYAKLVADRLEKEQK